MGHRHFHDRKSALLGASHHLGVHEKSAGLGQQLGQCLASKNLECAVHVSHAGAQEEAGQPVVSPGIELAQPGVLAVRAIACHDRKYMGEANESAEFRKIELAIGIGERNERILGGLEAGAECCAIALVCRMAKQSGMGGIREQILDDASGVVGAAVIHDEHLETGETATECDLSLANRTANHGCLVVRRHYKTELVVPRSIHAATMLYGALGQRNIPGVGHAVKAERIDGTGATRPAGRLCVLTVRDSLQSPQRPSPLDEADDMSMGLSPAVKAAVPRAVAMVEELVGELL